MRNGNSLSVGSTFMPAGRRTAWPWRAVEWAFIMMLAAPLAWAAPAPKKSGTAKTGSRDVAGLPARPSPQWLTHGTIYQILLRSFTPEGTLKAATRRLPDVADLGVTVAYLCPINLMDTDMRREFWSQRMRESAANNPRNPYRVKDHNKIDPEFGTDADLREFVDTAHKLGLRVMLDIVYTQTGPGNVLLKEHPGYFQHDANGRFKLTELYHFYLLDFKSPQLREYLWANMMHWVRDFGVDGFRCDCGGGVPLDFWEEARRRLEPVKPDLVMLDEGTRKADQLAAFDLNYSDWRFACQAVVTRGAPASALQAWWQRQHDTYPQGARLIYFSVNHDLTRPDVVFGERGAQAVAVLNFTLDGVPFLYNGQEIGDATPMDLLSHWSIQWDAAGVPTGGLFKRPLYQRLCQLRRSEPALGAGREGGEVAWLANDRPDSVLSFLRRAGGREILVAINFSNRALKVHLTLPDRSPARYRNLLAGLNPAREKSYSTDWIENGIQDVIKNPNDRLAEHDAVNATADGLTLDFAGFDYFVGRR